MVFGGMQKTSLIDYPGKVSCVLFTLGCNFRCPYCHNPELVKGAAGCASSTNGKEVYNFLERRKGFLDGVVISGGEPTLQKNLFRVCHRIKEMGYPIKLDTNGSRPPAVRELIDANLVDYIAMDIKTDLSNYPPFIDEECNPNSILSSIEIIMGSSLPYEFRTTCVRPIVQADTISGIAKIIKGSMLYALQHFNPGEVLAPEYFRNAEAVYGEDELMNLKSLAEPWVEKCIVR